jgi:hypothetical protein
MHIFTKVFLSEEKVIDTQSFCKGAFLSHLVEKSDKVWPVADLTFTIYFSQQVEDQFFLCFLAKGINILYEIVKDNYP